MLGVITPTVRSGLMPGQSGTPLVAVRLPRPQAATAITAAWDRGEAVLVLDPDAPRIATQRLLERFAPTHMIDPTGLHPIGGQPIEGQPIEGQPIEGQPIEGQPIEGQPIEGQAVEDGTAAIVVTSGTTGEPKGVELTFVGLEAIGTAFGSMLGVEPSDRSLVCLPLHHVAGLAILARARVIGVPVTVHDGFSMHAVAAAPTAEGATLVSLVPTMLGRLVDAGAPLHQFRRIIVGGSPTPPDLRARAESVGAPIVDAYGLSETWGGVVLDGEPIPGIEVKLSPDAEVLMRGPMVMRGYRNAPDATAAAFDRDGWFNTGDIGRWADDGRLHVVDRARDIVITGGVNVSPTAVENALAPDPHVSDVCVVGTADPEWGERVVAFVVAHDPSDPPTLEGLRAFGRDAGLSDPQLPRQLVLARVIPRAPSGKPLRRELRVPE
ncbi:MAG: AMP-dependent synthetase [Acidimicrobiia bacterium]|nr:AMP-dependent synthetase [Acidimicrobiia bacterium]